MLILNEELTGHEKYLMCMGYLQHVQDMAIDKGKPIFDILSEVSMRIDLKFTNMDIAECAEILEKIRKFSCTEIMKDVINEIENEGPLSETIE